MAPEQTLSDRELAALSHALLMIDDARLYGLVEGGPNINREQAEAIAERLESAGVVPTVDEVQATAIKFMRQWNAEREAEQPPPEEA